MFGNDIIGSSLFGSETTGGEMTFTPVSKNTTYLQIMDMVKMQTGSFKNPLISDPFLIKQISVSIQNIARQLPPEVQQKYYSYSYEGLSIVGSSNPYVCDLSAINPYVERPILFIHVTAGGVRTHTQDEDANKAENYSELPQYATTILGYYRSDALEIFKGSSFTMTIATDTITFRFIRQTIASGVTASSLIDLPDSMIQVLVSEVVNEVTKYNK